MDDRPNRRAFTPAPTKTREPPRPGVDETPRVGRRPGLYLPPEPRRTIPLGVLWVLILAAVIGMAAILAWPIARELVKVFS